MKVKAMLVLAGAVALAGATTVASAAKPELTGKQKKEMAAQVRENHKKAAPQPKTMAQSNAAKLRSASTGAEGQLVATDLWPSLHAHTDANGNVRVLESEGDLAPNTEGLPHE